ncbi:MAG: FAD/NAD(P)-binding oxidoreductase [Thermoprotei archaeon]
MDSAIRLRDEVEKFAGGTVAVGISRVPFKCPAAPYEVALLLEDYFTRKGIRDRTKFEFFTPEPNPVPAAGPEIGDKVRELFKSRGINYHPKIRLKEVKQHELDFETGETIPFDLLFCVPPHVAPAPVMEAGLTDQTGWVQVNPRTLETNSEGVYAVGDVTSVSTPHGYVPFLPKAGVFARGQAEVVANNIAAKVKGTGRAKQWEGNGSCFLEVGAGQSAFVTGNFLAEPKPEIEFRMPSRVWHAQKVIFERYWLRHWF